MVGRYRGQDEGLSCGLMFVSLFNGDVLARDLGDRVLDRISDPST
jgi:hypothetical protein